MLAYEAGRKHSIRVNTISAGPLGSRAAKAIGFIDDMIRYSYANAPVQKELAAQEVRREIQERVAVGLPPHRHPLEHAPQTPLTRLDLHAHTPSPPTPTAP